MDDPADALGLGAVGAGPASPMPDAILAAAPAALTSSAKVPGHTDREGRRKTVLELLRWKPFRYLALLELVQYRTCPNDSIY